MLSHWDVRASDADGGPTAKRAAGSVPDVSVEFTERNVDAAIDHVARHGAENRASLVHYSLVFEAADIVSPQELHHGGDSEAVTRFMRTFHDRCLERGYPPLDSLVVHVAGGRGGVPGAGYFKVNGQPDPYRRGASADDAFRGGAFLQAQRDECRRWGDARRRQGR